MDLSKLARFQFITRDSELSHSDLTREVYKSGGRWVQLRMKEKSYNEILQEAIKCVAYAKQHDSILIINDNVQLTKACGAQGVHLGKNDMRPSEARQILGNDYIIGGTANTFEDITGLIAEGVDYIGLGPYRFTNTKKNLSPILGIDGYRTIAEKLKQHSIRIPMVAIGGIEISDIESIAELGFGVALSNSSFEGSLETNCKKIIQKIFKNETIGNSR